MEDKPTPRLVPGDRVLPSESWLHRRATLRNADIPGTVENIQHAWRWTSQHDTEQADHYADVVFDDGRSAARWACHLDVIG